MRITIRPLTHADLDIACHISQLAYQTITDNRGKLRLYLQLQPDGWVLALLDGMVAGMVGTVDYGSFAYVGQLGVYPSAQGRGVGGALMEYILRWLTQRSCPTVLLDASAAGLPLYRRLGFIEEDQVIHWEGPESAGGAPSLSPTSPPTGSLTIFPIVLRDITAITAFDAPCFGAGRAALLVSLLMEYSGRAFVARDSAGNVRGYLFVQNATIGPWVAEEPAVAEALLARALALPFVPKPVVYSPVANREATELLERFGFCKARTLVHMRRGEPATFRRREFLYGQASLGLG